MLGRRCMDCPRILPARLVTTASSDEYTSAASQPPTLLQVQLGSLVDAIRWLSVGLYISAAHFLPSTKA